MALLPKWQLVDKWWLVMTFDHKNALRLRQRYFWPKYINQKTKQIDLWFDPSLYILVFEQRYFWSNLVFIGYSYISKLIPGWPMTTGITWKSWPQLSGSCSLCNVKFWARYLLGLVEKSLTGHTPTHTPFILFNNRVLLIVEKKRIFLEWKNKYINKGEIKEWQLHAFSP